LFALLLLAYALYALEYDGFDFSLFIQVGMEIRRQGKGLRLHGDHYTAADTLIEAQVTHLRHECPAKGGLLRLRQSGHAPYPGPVITPDALDGLLVCLELPIVQFQPECIQGLVVNNGVMKQVSRIRSMAAWLNPRPW